MTSVDDRANSGLVLLARGVRGPAWPRPEDLRRSARRRQLRRRHGLALASVAACVGLAVVAVTATGPAAKMMTVKAAPAPHVRVVVWARQGSASELMASVRPFHGAAASPASAAVAGAEQGFAVRLLRQLSRSQAGNITVSPLSLAITLTMLENGADGLTRRQIATALGTSAVTLARQDQGWASLLPSLAGEGGTGKAALENASSLWLQQGLPVRPAFMASLARYFSAGVWQSDFGDLAGTQQAVNHWVSEHTGGTIKQLFDPADIAPGTVIVLASASRFLAKWQRPFRPSDSAPGSFLTAQRQIVRVTYMTQSISHAAVTAGYDAVQLPYAGGRYAAVAIMPTRLNLARFINGLSPRQLSRIIAAASRGPACTLYLPRFTSRNYLRLNRALAAMGMPSAFTAAADFSAMSPAGLRVQSAVQRDYLSVGEKGTEAAAASGIGMGLSYVAHPAAARFDHPFLFLIRDTATGAVLFASLIQNPAA
jgi:serpin B